MSLNNEQANHHLDAHYKELRGHLMLMTKILYYFAAILPLSVIAYMLVEKLLHGPIPKGSNLFMFLEFSLLGSLIICLVSLLPLAGAMIVHRIHKSVE